MEVFLQNGFDFRDDPASGRLLLSAVPFRWGARRAAGGRAGQRGNAAADGRHQQRRPPAQRTSMVRETRPLQPVPAKPRVCSSTSWLCALAVPQQPPVLPSAHPAGPPPPGRSKNITFGATDVLELVGLLDGGAAQPLALGEQGRVVRPSRWGGAGAGAALAGQAKGRH